MSVRVADRNISKMEFIHNAQQLMFLTKDRITKYANKVDNKSRYKHLAKSINYTIWNSPIYHSQMVYKYCCLANIECDAHKRLEYLSIASQNLTLYETSLETMYHEFKSVIKDKFIMLATEFVDKEKALIKGCRNYVRNISCV